MIPALCTQKSRLPSIKTSGFIIRRGRSVQTRSVRSTWYQSNHILLLILIWAHFTKAIFLALEDSLPLAHIEDSGRDGLHGVIPFCRVLFLVSKGTIPQLFWFVIQLVVKKKGQGVQRADSRQQYCPLHVAGGQTNG